MSDTGRDAVAEVLGDLFSGFADLVIGPVGLLALGVGAVVALFWALVSAFPSRVHRWCKGTGHWGFGPFRRRCSGCGGSGLVDR